MVFLAHAREDADVLVALERVLRDRHIEVMRDTPQPTSNLFWREAIAPALRLASSIVVIWSRHADASPWLDQEIRGTDAPHVWLLRDGTPVRSDGPQRENYCGRSVGEVADVVGGLEQHSKHDQDACNSGPADSAWRRRECIDRGWRTLRALMMRPAEPVQFRRHGADWLVDEATSTTFRRVHSDAYLASTSVTSCQFLSAAGILNIEVPAAIDRLAPDVPAAGVTWFEAMAVCHWFGGTLPAERVWQHAASAGCELKYATASGGIDRSMASYGAPIGTGGAVPQTTYPHNPLGFFGMCGNTWDWCRDGWGGHRVIRGGCWMDSERFCRATARYRNSPVDRDSAVGFRVQVRVHKRSGDL